jgi:two-component system response regulator DesR
MSIRLVVAEADDASLVLKDLEALVQQVPDVEVVARCQSDEATLQAVRQHRPDVVVLTIGMPGPGDLEVLRQMRQAQPPTPVVLLAASLTDDALLEAMRLGIGGVVLYTTMAQRLLGCLRKVSAGDYWLDGDTVRGAVELLLRREVAACEQAQGLTPCPLEGGPLAATNLPQQASTTPDQKPG